MIQYNLANNLTPTENYHLGLLPQRNRKGIYYLDSSCRANLQEFSLSSENKRIIKKTDQFTFKTLSLANFKLDLTTQKQISTWIIELGWNFPINSVKTVFTNHLFNHLYLWYHPDELKPIAYSVCYFTSQISHIAYVFYSPQYSHSDLPIRLSLQAVIDSHLSGLEYCYLGRFDPVTHVGYYKRNFPGFEYYQSEKWIKYHP